MALLKPIRQSFQIDAEGRKAPDRLSITMRGDGHEDLRRSHIDSRGIGFDHGQADSFVALLGHDISLSVPLRRPEPCKKVVSQTRSSASQRAKSGDVITVLNTGPRTPLPDELGKASVSHRS